MLKTGSTPMKYVYRSSEGNTSMADLLSGKGANLADMAATRPASASATAGLDYVSCSPLRVPIARLATAQAALGDSQREDV